MINKLIIDGEEFDEPVVELRVVAAYQVVVNVDQNMGYYLGLFSEVFLIDVP